MHVLTFSSPRAEDYANKNYAGITCMLPNTLVGKENKDGVNVTIRPPAVVRAFEPNLASILLCTGVSQRDIFP